LISLSAFSQYVKSQPVNPWWLPNEEKERRLNLLNYDKNFTVLSIKKYREKINYEIYKVKLASKHPNFSISVPLITDFYWYRPKFYPKPQPLPLVIISPPIVGVDPLEKILAHNFTENEPFYNTFILDYDEKINDKNRPLSGLNDSFIKSIVQGRLLLDFAETQKETIDSRKIACYGMSLGGIMSALLLEVDPRVKAAIIIVGGGNFPEILRNSKQNIVKGYREARMKAERIKTLDELENKTRDLLLFDPLYFASKRPSRDVYMVMAMEDTAVPTKNQMELFEAFRRPSNFKHYDANHAPTIFKNLPFHMAIVNYLNWRFKFEQ
ncbi:MAG: alpha/beta hydrolase family protein, partial [Bacteriovoracales bacterium]